MAKKFADEGAQVVITGRDIDRLKAAQEEIGDRAHPFQMDVRNVEHVQGLLLSRMKNLAELMDW